MSTSYSSTNGCYNTSATRHCCARFVKRYGMKEKQQSKGDMVDTSKREIKVVKVYFIHTVDIRVTCDVSIHDSQAKGYHPNQKNTEYHHSLCDVLSMSHRIRYGKTSIQRKRQKIDDAGDVRKLLERIAEDPRVHIPSCTIDVAESDVDREERAEYGTIENVNKYLIEEKNVW